MFQTMSWWYGLHRQFYIDKTIIIIIVVIIIIIIVIIIIIIALFFVDVEIVTVPIK